MSPMRRCIETGDAIAKTCGVEAEIMDQLNDIDYGAWQWRTYEEMKEAEPALFTAWFTMPQRVRFPNGESRSPGPQTPSASFSISMPDDTVVLASHDNLIRALLLQLLDQLLSAYRRLAQDPCCINEIDAFSKRVDILRINETRHLDGLGT